MIFLLKIFKDIQIINQLLDLDYLLYKFKYCLILTLLIILIVLLIILLINTFLNYDSTII